MENLIFLFHFLRLTLLHYIYPNPRLSFHFFILFWLLCAFYYCKSLLPTIGRLDPRVPPGSVLLYSTVKLTPNMTLSTCGTFNVGHVGTIFESNGLGAARSWRPSAATAARWRSTRAHARDASTRFRRLQFSPFILPARGQEWRCKISASLLFLGSLGYWVLIQAFP